MVGYQVDLVRVFVNNMGQYLVYARVRIRFSSIQDWTKAELICVRSFSGSLRFGLSRVQAVSGFWGRIGSLQVTSRLGLGFGRG